MKVLHLITRPQRRGAEIFAVDLANHLVEPFESHVASILPYHGEDELVSPQLIRLDQSHGRWLATSSVTAFLALRRQVEELGISVVIAHGSSALKYASVLKRTKRSLNVIYRCIGEPSYWARSVIRRRLNKMWLANVDYVVCTSIASKIDFERHYGNFRDRVVTVPNAVDIEYFSADFESPMNVRHMLGIDQKASLLITVGKLSDEKNHRELVRILAGLVSTGADCHLLVVGSGPLRGLLEKDIEELGLGGRVHLVGAHADVRPFLAASDLFVMSSKTEGMPAAVIEAGIMGLPAVAYDVGGVSEVVKDGVTGRLIPYGQFEAFVKAVLCLVDDHQTRKSMGTEASRLCRERFGIADAANKYVSVINHLLVGGHIRNAA